MKYDLLASEPEKKKSKDKMKLANIYIELLDDGTYLCEKRYGGGYSDSKKSSHET